MTRTEELLKRADLILNSYNSAPDETHKAEIDILREAVGMLKRALETMLSNEERQGIQYSVARNLRKIIALTRETDELMDSAIKLEAIVKELSNPPAQN